MDRTTALKCAIVAALALVLLIPVSMIRDLIAERQARRDEAVSRIALGWGQRQVIAGPYLAVPYERIWTETTKEIVDGKSRERHTERTEALVARYPVETVDWSIDAATNEKARGIYKARLYSARIRAKGRVVVPERVAIANASSRIRWFVPRLVVGVADLRGIHSVSPLSIGGRQDEFLVGAGDNALAAGVHALLSDLEDGNRRTLEFEFSLELAGAEALALAPLARDTTVALRADWPHPSFQGVFLPARHELGPDGFTARWQVSRFAAQGAERLASCERNKPCAALTAQELGVSFIAPAGLYQQLERASKYGFLFIGLTFAAFYLLELFRRLPIHPIQYTLVGLALAMFFLLLTALSEHIAFAPAYAAATLACTGLVAAYVAHVLRNARAGAAFGGALAALYGALYMLLSAEDYALLAGSLLLFGLLAGLMLATRRVDWYRLTRSAPAPGVTRGAPS
ncbi:MAG: cell envelope integrity protein CreD [Betaproteobacteria bacterium]|nr:cell envelope integrity protein CreD [Betaproteobacteria bacterium]